MNPPPQPIVSEFNWSVLTVAVLHTAVCPRDRAEMGVSVWGSPKDPGPDMLTKKLLHRRLRRQSLRIFCHKGIKFACVSIVWRLFQSSRCALPVSVWANMERSVLILSALLEQSRLETLVGCALWGIHNWFFRGLPPILQIRNLLHILVDLPRFFSYHYFYCS
jgi:hypothetical protein